jgi:hypothetical protein
MRPHFQYRNHGTSDTDPVRRLPTGTAAASDQDWFVVEVADEKAHLVAQAARFERCYPHRYDIRVAAADQGRNPEAASRKFALAVRHR